MPARQEAELPPLRPRQVWIVAGLLATAYLCARAAGMVYLVWPRLLLAGFSLLLLAVVSLWAIPALLRRSALRRVFRRNVEFQLTKGGWVFVASVLLLMGAALNSGNNLLYLLAASLLAALLVSGLISSLSLSGMTLDYQLPERLFAAAETPLTIKLSNEKRWLAGYGLSVRPAGGQDPGMAMEPVYFPYIPRHGQATAATRIRFAERGAYQAGSLALATGFPFGLIRKWRRFRPETHDRPILVYPALQPGAPQMVGRAENGEHAMGRPGPGEDLYRIRPHQPGDEARHVHWKATARLGSLRVREFSQEERPRARLVANWPAGPSAQREHEISEYATLVWELAQHDGELEFTGYNLTRDPTAIPPAARRKGWLARLGTQPARAAKAALETRPFYLPPRPAREHLDAVLRYLALVDLSRPPISHGISSDANGAPHEHGI